MKGSRPPSRAPRRDHRPGPRRRRPSEPYVAVAEIVERDGDGDLFVRAASGRREEALVRLSPSKSEASAGAPAVGERILARFEISEAGETEARLIKKLGQSAHQVLGVARRSRGETRIEPVDRRSRASIVLSGPEAAKVRDGDLVLARIDAGGGSPHGPKRGRLVEVVGTERDPRAASLIAIHSHGVPTGFSSEALAEAEALAEPDTRGRADLRHLPFVTIDPADARDRDDAVFAEPDPDPANKAGWIVWVAIADVAHFVRAGSALDRAAREKGNSVYFPDRVEPMLPERLSAGLCSLHSGVDRACLAVRMSFDSLGRRRSHRFERALMRSAAALAYEQAQAALDGAPDEATGPLLAGVLEPLWKAWRTIETGRAQSARGAQLALESAERRIVLGEAGEVVEIRPRAQLDAHRLIETMMIAANVCAAETLERRKVPLIFRVHEPPSEEKLRALADFLVSLDIPWSMGEAATPARFNRLLEKTRGGPHGEIVNEVVLRTQMQARYSADNLGHFGLGLDRYAHFTSPIRRYADLTVHRGLIEALALGPDGLTRAQGAGLADLAERITLAERRGMAAERDAADRYVAAFLESRLGAVFAGRIVGVTRFGLFVRLAETGADGLIPIAALGSEYWIHEEGAHVLVGERSGAVWRLGAEVEVRLKEAAPLTGGLIFEMLSEPEPASVLRRSRSPKGRRTRPTGRSRPPRRSPPRGRRP
ncbi:MAG: ribonuclease R [Caulobacteraceae bacterium]